MHFEKGLKSRAFLAVLTAALVFSGAILFQARSLTIASLTVPSQGDIGSIVTQSLHVDGKWLKDEQGRIVILRGVNKPGPVDHPSGLWDRDRVFSTDDVIHNLDAMGSWGMNVARIFYPCDWWIDDYDNFRQNLKNVAHLAAERGIYIVYSGYQVINYPAGGRQDSLPWHPYHGGSESAGADNYIATRQDWVNMMSSVATELGTQAGFNNVIFELWNEPNGAGMSEWFTGVQEAINAIRATGAQNLIMVQWLYDLYWRSSDNHNTMSWIDQMSLTGTNVFYSTHIYFKDGSLGAPTSLEDCRTRLTDCMVPWINQVPILVGEISGEIDQPAQVQGFAWALQILNEWDIGYAGWWWRDDGAHPLISDYYPNYTPTSNGQILRDAIAAAG